MTDRERKSVRKETSRDEERVKRRELDHQRHGRMDVCPPGPRTRHAFGPVHFASRRQEVFVTPAYIIQEHIFIVTVVVPLGTVFEVHEFRVCPPFIRAQSAYESQITW